MDCIHLGFCLSLPQVNKILIEKGIKPREVRTVTIGTEIKERLQQLLNGLGRKKKEPRADQLKMPVKVQNVSDRDNA